MITKINSIIFNDTNCASNKEKDFISNLLTSNAYYSPAKNSIKICAGYLLQSTCAFHIVDTLAHEIAHSFDPCEIDYGPQDSGFHYSVKTDAVKSEQEYPVSKVIQCLRSSSSVAARNFQLEENEKIQQQLILQAQQIKLMQQQQQQLYGGVKAPVAAITTNLPDGGGGIMQGMTSPPVKPVNFCEKDQISESFSDWIAAETLPRYIKKNYNLSSEQYQTGYSNTKRVGCILRLDADAARRENTDEHPLAADRINKIYLSNPKIREQMGCAERENKKAVYCDNVSTYGGGLGGRATSVTSTLINGGVGMPPILPTVNPAAGAGR